MSGFWATSHGKIDGEVWPSIMFIPCPSTSAAWWPPIVIAKEMSLSVDWEKMLKFLRADFEQPPTAVLMFYCLLLMKP